MKEIVPISGFSEIDPISIAQMSSTMKAQPTPLLTAAKTLPSIVDQYGSLPYVTKEAKKAAKLIDVDDYQLKSFFNIRSDLGSAHFHAAKAHPTIQDVFLKRLLLNKRKNQSSDNT
eukprot:COSAG02_NODE_29723_length_564_cov_0.911828_1_plen_116_part_01